jgi:hypothetical protein
MSNNKGDYVAAQERAEEETGAAPSHEEICARAHELWISGGCQEGAADKDWLEAERELVAKHATIKRAPESIAERHSTDDGFLK